MKAAPKIMRVRNSSGNVFADMGARDARAMLAKARLAHRICQVIATRGLTQTRAAESWVSINRKSALLHGKLRGFSSDRLFRCLNDLDQEVESSIRRETVPQPRKRWLRIAAIIRSHSHRSDALGCGRAQ